MQKISFRYLWIGQSFANIGDVLYMVSLITAVYQVTSSVTYMALIPFLITTSRFVSGIIAPLIMEHIPLKVLLAYSQLGKTVIMLLLICTATLSAHVSLIFIFVALVAFLDGWATPARNALIPVYVEKSVLVRANSFLATLDQTINLSGWAVGGIIVTLIGVNDTLSLTFILYIVATLCMFRIDNVSSASEDSRQTASKWDMLKEGWVTVLHHPTLRTISVTVFFESIANVVWVAAIMYIYVEQVLHVSTHWWGYINASFFAGLMIGGFVSFKWSQFIDHHPRYVICIGAVTIGIFTFLFGIISSPWIALMISCLFGIASQTKGITQLTIIQQSVVQRLLPKVYAVQDVLVTATFGISSLALGALTDMWGVRTTFIFAALLLAISAIYVIANRKNLINEGMYPKP
ncbi:MFS transporter [Staphylococcus rostri]|uniref:MFS transporter n=1 Tax=Staphylococcus rostri TaxID=522262 RepID=A0A2K3YMG2_9STAP|nr:MFS transporter [Staphylococcus rostri]PNZ26796.1 MFS transporter [Staphylococcus rostri]